MTEPVYIPPPPVLVPVSLLRAAVAVCDVHQPRVGEKLAACLPENREEAR